MAEVLDWTDFSTTFVIKLKLKELNEVVIVFTDRHEAVVTNPLGLWAADKFKSVIFAFDWFDLSLCGIV